MAHEYLVTVLSTFENTIEFLPGNRSLQANATIKAVKKYSKEQTANCIRDVYYCWEAWRRLQPGEFQRRAEMIQQEFETQMMREYKRHNIPLQGDAAPQQGITIPLAPATAINRWTNLKIGAKVGMGVASVGITAAQYGTGSAGLATIAEGAIVGTAVAVSATGIGLIAGGVALTVASSVLSAVAAVKSANHRDNLIKIYEDRNKRPFSEEKFCQVVSAVPTTKTRTAYVQHDMIANHVLPYVITQKDRKVGHKAVAAVPLIGMIETVRAAGRYAYKAWVTGSQGVARKNAAAWLVTHLITCNCLLVQAIVAELYSVGEMEWLKTQPYPAVTKFVETKLKCT
jgi:hypothetical protein